MFKLFGSYFWKPEAQDIAHKTIADYQLQLLSHEANASYHAKMAEYYEEGIKRLAQQYRPSFDQTQ